MANNKILEWIYTFCGEVNVYYDIFHIIILHIIHGTPNIIHQYYFDKDKMIEILYLYLAYFNCDIKSGR